MSEKSYDVDYGWNTGVVLVEADMVWWGWFDVLKLMMCDDL